jgi:hypothetical protein
MFELHVMRVSSFSPFVTLLTLTPHSPSPAPLDPPVPTARVRRVRVIHFCPWAGRLQDGGDFLRTLPALDLRSRLARPDDAALQRMARLDCDWHGENVRALGAMRHPALEFLPVETVGAAAALDVVARRRPPDEAWWFVITGQHPQSLGAAAGPLFAAYARHGIRILFYAFDEASRTMPVFADIAPHLSVLLHDEAPLADGARARLRPDCLIRHRSWVANLVPWATPLIETPEERIVFLGSKLGLTPHRQRQVDFLRRRFRDKFTAICDHSLPVADRLGLARCKVGLCPEGRKFGTPAMSATHTDRPFWSGCLGMVPVSEDSQAGGRLEELHRAGLIMRYPHGDLAALAAACERALAATPAERRRIYEHFNRHETVGAVVAQAIADSDHARD